MKVYFYLLKLLKIVESVKNNTFSKCKTLASISVFIEALKNLWNLCKIKLFQKLKHWRV